jgi:DNA-binding NtrC family response regulator
LFLSLFPDQGGSVNAARVLIVDDDPEMGSMLETGLSRLGHAVSSTTSADAAYEAVIDDAVDVVATDVRMRGMNGIELCERIVETRPDVPVIVMTGFGSLETAVATIRAGAFDFLQKPLDTAVLAVAIERAIAHRRLQSEVRTLRRAVTGAERCDDLLGASPPMKKVYDLIARVADAEATTLITGESGTGKELVARALHRLSSRKSGPFVAINCAAIPETLLESELFGHKKGAFTDAKADKLGLFVEASGGTLFLDEVSEMSTAMQAKLLRALETRKVRAVGDNGETAFSARIVAATNRDLDASIESGSFRQDLLFRLNVLSIELPPLRARGGDVLLLAQHFLDRFAARMQRRVVSISPGVAEKLLAYPFPGNVRELQNCIERAVALARYEVLAVEDLPDKVKNHKRSAIPIDDGESKDLVPMDEVERRYVVRVLEASGGNKNLAARILGWDRKTLYRRLERWAT